MSNDEALFVCASLVGAYIGTTYAAVSDLDQNPVRIGFGLRDISDVYLTHSTKNSCLQGIPSDLISALTRVNFFDAETSLRRA